MTREHLSLAPSNLISHRNCGRATDSVGPEWAGSRTSWRASLLYYARSGERFMTVNQQEFAQAQKRARAGRRTGYAVAARYDPRTSRIVLRLNTDLELALPPSPPHALPAP